MRGHAPRAKRPGPEGQPEQDGDDRAQTLLDQRWCDLDIVAAGIPAGDR